MDGFLVHGLLHECQSCERASAQAMRVKVKILDLRANVSNEM